MWGALLLVLGARTRLDRPVVGVRREGHLWLDVRALFAADLDYVAAAVAAAARPPPGETPGAPPET